MATLFETKIKYFQLEKNVWIPVRYIGVYTYIMHGDIQLE